MSWLRNHLRHFVLPGIHTLARAHGKPMTASDIRPRDKEIRPASDCKYVEAGLLYALVSSVMRKGDPLREVTLGLCRQIGQGKDSEFVYAIDKRGDVKNLGAGYNGVEGSDVLHSMLCNSMRRLKRKMRRNGQLLLPGRDVWCWEVMARKLSVDSTFDSRVSRNVAYNTRALKVCIDDWQIQDWSDVLFFDTGFSGSIPRAIGGVVGLSDINVLMLSCGDDARQIFRTHTASRKKALAFEYLSKYFASGTPRDDKPYQELASLDEFIRAALLTIWLWYHVSPTRLPSYREKKLPSVSKSSLLKQYGQTAVNAKYTGTWVVESAATTTTPVVFSGTGGPISMITSASGTGITDSCNDLEPIEVLKGLWGAGVDGELILDKAPGVYYQAMPAFPQTVEDQMASQSGIALPTSPPIKLKPVGHTKKFKPKFLDPMTFELKDAYTGQSVEDQIDAKALGIVKGHEMPTADGYGLGQYPGPPVVSTAALKMLAGIPPDGPLPEITLSLEAEPPNESGVGGVVFKKTTFKTPLGIKEYKTPLTG